MGAPGPETIPHLIKIYGASNWSSRGEAYTLKVTHKPGYVEREPNN